ncbi:MAG: hypothetical protein HZA50_05405 [Planctomycetes bacterium]|nr:hypothetical protein [Planctomycetota bacterium]
MGISMQTTCWRGMRLEHPSAWELTTVGGEKQPGRCIFSDRRYQRLQVLWREVKYVPELTSIMEKHRRDAKAADKLTVLKDAPEPWQGVVRKAESGWVVNAGRFFRQNRWLVEAMFVWPGARDVNLENRILASITPADDQDEVMAWQAMGLDVSVPKEYELEDCSLQVGRIRWKFASPHKKAPMIAVERLAMAGSWLKSSPGDWLDAELPIRDKRLFRGQDRAFAHPADWIVSRGRAGRLAALARLKRINLDLAWICPAEDRLYHITVSRLQRRLEIELPAGLCVQCCRDAPAIKSGD